MDNIIRNKIKNSAIAALTIALLFPALWFIVLGTTNRTPIVEKVYLESMTIQDREKWFQDNLKPASLFEHIKETPSFLFDNWRGYIKSSMAVFAVVFVINGTFVFWRHGK